MANSAQNLYSHTPAWPETNGNFRSVVAKVVDAVYYVMRAKHRTRWSDYVFFFFQRGRTSCRLFPQERKKTRKKIQNPHMVYSASWLQGLMANALEWKTWRVRFQFLQFFSAAGRVFDSPHTMMYILCVMCYNRIGFIFVSPTAADATHWIEKKKNVSLAMCFGFHIQLFQ